MNKITALLAVAWLAGLLSGCDSHEQNDSPASTRQSAGIVNTATTKEQAVIGRSGTCDEPPKTISVADTSYTFAHLDPAEEPVMNLGYVACDQGRFTPGDGGPGTLVINGTAPSDGKPKAVIFIGSWGRALYEADSQEVTSGAAISPKSGDAQVTAKDVRLVYMTFPIPIREVSSPLFGSRDQDRIAALLHKLNEAERIDGTGLTSPLDGRSKALNIELSDGRLLQIRPAWTCNSGKDDAGNTTTSCTPVDNRIMVSGLDVEAYFAKSEWLYLFVGKAYLDWMPNVNPYEAPNALKTGASFVVRGHGSRAERASVALMKGNKVILSLHASVNEGEWQVEGVTPDSLPAGDYEWTIDTGTTKYGVGVLVSK